MILEQLQQLLANGKHMTIPDLAERIPDLHGREEAEQILYLLLRLDKRFDRNGELWFSTVVKEDPRARIIAAAQDYFQAHPRGEMTEHLVEAVVQATGQPGSLVRDVILTAFRGVQNGKMILNQRRKE